MFKRDKGYCIHFRYDSIGDSHGEKELNVTLKVDGSTTIDDLNRYYRCYVPEKPMEVKLVEIYGDEMGSDGQ